MGIVSSPAAAEHSASFADDLAAAVPPPSAADVAWHEGFSLASDGLPASCPSGYADEERRAWERGYEAAVEVYDRACLDAAEAMFAEMADRDVGGLGTFGLDANEWEGR